ncbi:MAG: MBL fold metallo-hydrolase [Dehalococcoidales bacterium]|nr:MAG: MBL fold metallo-hydrolase [Dehalococcoidales bacterium]
MPIKITTLSENTAAFAGLLAEYGLSVLVETDEANVLLDTGLSISVPHNVEALDIDLKKIDKIVISHGHHDHTGGLRGVLRKMRKSVDVIGHPDIMTSKYAKREGFPAGYIGIPFDRRELEHLGANFILTPEPVSISENITTSGEVPMVSPYEDIDPHLKVKAGGELVPDEFLDDRALFIRTDEGLVVILGCAHRGIINTLYHAQELTGEQRIEMVIGGCHLMGSSEERVWLTIAALKELGVKKVGVSHCTSLPAAAMMAREFGENFFFNNAGTRIELE